MITLRGKNSRLALIASVLLHVVMLLIFLLIKLNFTIEFPEFTEITFVSGKNSIAAMPSMPGSALPPAIADNRDERAPELVNLPPRSMAELEEPQLKVIDQAKQVPDEEIQTIPEIEHANHRKDLVEAALSNPNIAEKEMASPTKITPIDDKLLPSASLATGETGQTPYQIEGPAASRTVVYKVIPQYPENLQKQAMVKIRFTVLSNGHIGEMIPVIKSDAELERVTLDALRQWRFNPLPAESPPRTERGVITFRYLLR